IYLHTTIGTSVLLTSTSSTATGTYTATAAPQENGTLVATVSAVSGYQDATSDTLTVPVTSSMTITAPTRVASGQAASVTVVLKVGRPAPIAIQQLTGSTWTTLGTATAPNAGAAKLTITGLSSGKHTLRASFGGDARGAAATSP